MEVIQGKTVGKGVAIGQLYFFEEQKITVRREKIANEETEQERITVALEKADHQLLELVERAGRNADNGGAQIFEVHRMMLADSDYVDSIRNIISTQMVCAEYAVATTADNFAGMFAAMDDEYMQGRAADVKDVSERLIRILCGQEKALDKPDGEVILCAEDLTPSQTMELNLQTLAGIVLRKGSTNSHTAILARSMGIPALVQTDIKERMAGKEALLDAEVGKLIVEPSEEVREKGLSRIKQLKEEKELLQQLVGKPSVTRSGKRVNLYANVKSVADVADALAHDAEGIGLFRSEFLYLNAKDYPSEEEQFLAYKTVVQNMAGKKVIIRTLDIGADKQAPYFHLGEEENPAMGLRAIRICLKKPEILKTQLRAILRASAFGNLDVMYPMIISTDEVHRVKQIFDECKKELLEAGFPLGEVKQGIMIETPASVFISAELAGEVDFFSIGTNDLTQYLLAIDRQNEQLSEFYDEMHPAVLRAIRQVAENAHKAGIWVGICGELGADTRLTQTFIDYGIDELSVTPPAILAVRNVIRESK